MMKVVNSKFTIGGITFVVTHAEDWSGLATIQQENSPDKEIEYDTAYLPGELFQSIGREAVKKGEAQRAHLNKLLACFGHTDILPLQAEWIVEADDPRHQVLLTPEPIEPLLDTLDLDQFDLIFVDNSDSGERRCDTLRYVASRCGQSIVVAHDYDIPSYCEAATGFSHGIIDDRQKPYTALLWR